MSLNRRCVDAPAVNSDVLACGAKAVRNARVTLQPRFSAAAPKASPESRGDAKLGRQHPAAPAPEPGAERRIMSAPTVTRRTGFASFYLIHGTWRAARILSLTRPIAVTAGSFVHRVAKMPHYDGVKKGVAQPAIIAILGIGPIHYHLTKSAKPAGASCEPAQVMAYVSIDRAKPSISQVFRGVNGSVFTPDRDVCARDRPRRSAVGTPEQSPDLSSRPRTRPSAKSPHRLEPGHWRAPAR
jgi:hypothetical protein